MTTARYIVKKALQKIGALTKSEAPASDEASDGLDALNDMISSWSNDSLLIYARLSENFPLVSGQAEYTIGVGGNFNTAKPLQILTAFTRIGNIDYNIEVISDTEYDGIPQKDIKNSIPDVLFYSQSEPLGKITFYPVPTTGSVYIRTEKQLTQLPSLNTDLEFPAGWVRALIYNLALELAPEYGQPVPNDVAFIASESLNKIKTATARNKNMDAFSYEGNLENIYSGWFT